MKDWQNLAHVKWECKYHLVIVPKYRRKVLFGRSRRQVGTILRQLCRQKGVDLLEGHAMPDHIHLVLSISPKYSVAMVVGYLKGKSAIQAQYRLQRTKKRRLGFDVFEAYLGNEPAVMFLGHRSQDTSTALRRAGLCAYHSRVKWGVVTNYQETVVFNPHWVRDKSWYSLPSLPPDRLLEDLATWQDLTPDGIEQGRLAERQLQKSAPNAYLTPVDDGLVECLDLWRNEAVRYSESSAVDDDLQTIFAQLFVLRAVEDRALCPSLPPLKGVLNSHTEADFDRLAGIFKVARQTIQSELFEVPPPRDIPAFVVGGVIQDLYRPRDFAIPDATTILPGLTQMSSEQRTRNISRMSSFP